MYNMVLKQKVVNTSLLNEEKEMNTYTPRTGNIYSDANSEALNQSHQGEDGITVVRLGLVYSIIEKMRDRYEAELQKMQRENERLRSQKNEA